MILVKIFKYIFILPGVLLYTIHVLFVGLREQSKNGAWDAEQLSQFVTRVAVHMAEHIEQIEWLSFVIWAGFFIWFFNANYAKWIY